MNLYTHRIRVKAMFDCFTDQARKVMGFSRQEAERFNHDFIGSEHILLGIVKEDSAAAARILRSLDVNLDEIGKAVEQEMELAPPLEPMGQLPFTQGARKVLSYTVNEAKAQPTRYVYVGTELLLVGLLQETGGIAASALNNLGVHLADVREVIDNFYIGWNSTMD